MQEQRQGTSQGIVPKCDGWILLDKPRGMTSTHVGSCLKRSLRPWLGRVEHLGHVGTLDPLATGVLVIALGKATKLIPYLEHHEHIWGLPQSPRERPRKVYEFDLTFGQETTTYDAEGDVVCATDVLPTVNALQEVLPRFFGLLEQKPPIYSALKLNGRKLYELARTGHSVSVPARSIWIESLTLVDFSPPTARFRAEVSQGTYIRSLGHDLAKAAGSLGHITRLRRLRDGLLDITMTRTLEASLELLDRGRLDDVIIPLEAVLGDIPAVSVGEDAWSYLRVGRPCSVAAQQNLPAVRIRYEGRLVGMGRVAEGVCYPRRLLWYEKGVEDVDYEREKARAHEGIRDEAG